MSNIAASILFPKRSPGQTSPLPAATIENKSCLNSNTRLFWRSGMGIALWRSFRMRSDGKFSSALSHMRWCFRASYSRFKSALPRLLQMARSWPVSNCVRATVCLRQHQVCRSKVRSAIFIAFFVLPALFF